MFVHKNNLSTHRLSDPLLLLALSMAIMIISVPKVRADNTPQSMQVYKSPSCGCCTAWVKHMKRARFNTVSRHPNNLNAIKKQFNISLENQACHTSTLQGYAFEGHIPANVIQKFLIEKPKNSIGLAVPGMPVGSPGMDTNKNFSPYQVLLLGSDGSHTPYAEVSAGKTVFLERKS